MVRKRMGKLPEEETAGEREGYAAQQRSPKSKGHSLIRLARLRTRLQFRHRLEKHLIGFQFGS